MIKCEVGAVTIKGNKTMIMAELCALIHSLLDEDDKILTEEEVDMIVADAKKSVDTIAEETAELRESVSPKDRMLADLLTALSFAEARFNN